MPTPRYHHGALSDALLEAAAEVLETDGLEALSLREVARRAGVSTAAPYHHFPDKQALQVALAIEGFEDLEASLRRDSRRATPGKERLRAVAFGYLRFARKRPALYQLMFSPLLAEARGRGPLFEASLRALSVLAESIDSAEPVDVVLAWALGHGVATLMGLDLLHGPRLGAPGRVDRAVMERLVELLLPRRTSGGARPSRP